MISCCTNVRSLSLNVLGPVPAITEALKKAGLTLNNMDLVEVCLQCKNNAMFFLFRLCHEFVISD